MKTLASLIMIMVLNLPVSTLAKDPAMRADIEKDIPLAEAIRQANARFPDVQPLTEDEVVAAVRDLKVAAPDMPQPIFEIYQRIVTERVLPKGMYFSHISGYTSDHVHYDVDWKDLTLTTHPAGAKYPQMNYGYNYRIRARFISSQPQTEEEIKDDEANTKKMLEHLGIKPDQPKQTAPLEVR